MITLNLRALLNEVILEVGDMEQISPYKYSKTSNISYNFITEQNDTVNVEFPTYPLKDIKDSLPNDIDENGEFTNIEFSIEGVDSQFKKSNYKYLVKILKTILNITLDYLENNYPKYILIAASNKSPLKSQDEFDPQKTQLYQSMVLKNLNKLPKYDGNWGYRKIPNVIGIKGDSILLYNGN
jgi:hypothetical protein